MQRGRWAELFHWKGRIRVLWALVLVCVAAALWQPKEAVTVSATAAQPCVALTFDDGPRRDTTTALLDGLSQRGVPATFFLVGTFVENNEDIVLRMDREGHQVGIHSQNHRALTGLSGAALYWEVDELRERLTALLGPREFMVRPPYGMTNQAVCRGADGPIILWSVDPEDWSDEDSARQVEHIVSRAQDGDIILLHDIYPSSVATALRVVDELLARGFYFTTVEDLFALRGIQPEKGVIYRSLPD